MLAEAILVHGDIGYKFCWLLLSKDQNQGTPAGHEISEQGDSTYIQMNNVKQ